MIDVVIAAKIFSEMGETYLPPSVSDSSPSVLSLISKKTSLIWTYSWNEKTETDSLFLNKSCPSPSPSHTNKKFVSMTAVYKGKAGGGGVGGGPVKKTSINQKTSREKKNSIRNTVRKIRYRDLRLPTQPAANIARQRFYPDTLPPLFLKQETNSEGDCNAANFQLWAR